MAEEQPQIGQQASAELTPPSELTYHQRYYLEHKELIKARNKLFYENHKEKYKKLKRRWLRNHPEKVQLYAATRKAKQQAIRQSKTSEQENPTPST